MNNVLGVAYLGDAIYELFIRDYLIKVKNLSHPKEWQKESIKYVSASSQRRILEELINNNYLTDEELELIRKGRNAKGTKTKSADIITYRYATALEYLFGILYLNEDYDRIKKIMERIVG